MAVLVLNNNIKNLRKGDIKSASESIYPPRDVPIPANGLAAKESLREVNI